jgi:hypothetical protein
VLEQFDGIIASGEFCFTLTVTDIATGWTINRSVKNRAAIWVCEAIKHVIAQFPFPILGIDSDNGAEFINAHLLGFCIENEITFHPVTAGQQERRGPRRAEELDPRAGAGRLSELYRQIQDLTTQIERMALNKAPAAVRPRVNRAFVATP